MISPDFPHNEDKRIEALARYQLLDTESESDFDSLTKMIAEMHGAPVSLISLVDTDRQWFKSKVGLQVSSTDRNISFCGHAILSDDVFYVEDATRDERFSDNPLVTGPPYIRTYAGAPIVSSDGYHLGTTCVMFDQVTPLTSESRAHLRHFSTIAASMMEARLSIIQNRACDIRSKQLIGMLGHELKTPLAALQMMLAEQQVENNEPFGQMIVDTADHLMHLTKDIEATARNEISPRTSRLERDSLFAILKRVLLTLRFLIEPSGIHVSLLTDSGSDQVLFLQKHKLRQVLTNLIKNAVIHSSAGQINIEIKTRKISDDRFGYCLSVKDNGIGIPVADAERVFGAGERGETKASGSGLGLAVCKDLIESIGGQITLNSTAGCGAEFIIEFEACINNQLPASDEKASEKVILSNTLSGKRILLVDDDLTLRLLGQAMLQKQGATVFLAEHGEKALRVLEGQAIDVLITDLLMPVLNGWELIKACKKSGFSGHIIVISGNSDPDTKRELKSLGVQSALSKPLNLEKLAALLE